MATATAPCFPDELLIRYEAIAAAVECVTGAAIAWDEFASQPPMRRLIDDVTEFYSDQSFQRMSSPGSPPQSCSSRTGGLYRSDGAAGSGGHPVAGAA